MFTIPRPTLQGWAFRSTSSPEAVSTHEESTANVPLPLNHFGSAFDCQSSQRVVAAVDKILDEMKLQSPCTKQPSRNGQQVPKTGYSRERTTLTSLPNHKKNRSYSAFGKFGRQKSRVQKIIDEFLQSARTRGLYDRSTSSDQRTNHTTSLDRSKQTVAADAVANSTSTPSSERTEQTSTCWTSLDINLNSTLHSPEVMRSWENNYEASDGSSIMHLQTCLKIPIMKWNYIDVQLFARIKLTYFYAQHLYL
ncbi:uncharacterized protein DEA37_0003803 [Paragonimus westermani]|uniref:Uncharacterized protein n=1 Tax=Paragonimus westermani TaxID=34504 RepID=A0A5J4NL29_9TREM|nr:uncharacterized protein DEA37_0003803 [Paragonimus westermani]